MILILVDLLFSIGKSSFKSDHIFADQDDQCKGMSELYGDKFKEYAEIDLKYSETNVHLPLVYACYCNENPIATLKMFDSSLLCSDFTS